MLLDVDGVLAPIVRHAEDAHVPEPTRVPLIAVAKRYGLVACITGRRAATARRIVSLGSITYVGNHGAEVLRGGATEVELDPEVAAWSQRIAQWADAAWNDQLHRLRVRAEDKDVIRAYLVNLKHAVELRAQLNGTAVLIMRDDTEIPVARRNVAALRRRLHA